ncbi:sterol desaturase family protein [Ectopseudomonas guguanensis]|uniref:Sterol desaturase/sphingolipid hydroxylase, fatty acid hydroxylase superfamily n=1 Tax=Ectopseudomonas guguanensis TaxID=1198456 RepID=A0A1H0WGZ0_9GAMM|nr:sterol desaturase family protein [Pseudomonas guguanensis]SDP89994.1 Sterol desaturase/sphingolipid hydroxylase, fatty acid hydroxylase superfamily [Pseudomonas guguanensis]
MQELSLAANPLTELLAVVIRQFQGLFDLNGRIGLVFILLSYSVAYLLYRRRRVSSGIASFWQFIGGRQVLLHPSALLDYRYYFVRALLRVLLIVPVIGLVDPYLLHSADYMAFFTNLWGARPQLGENLGLSLLYGLGVFLINDFASYWTHRAFHSRWLWEFHKVHHVAPVLVPLTASRVHVVEKLADSLLTLVLLGAYSGTFWYLCGGEISRYTLFGVTYLVFIFNCLAANLRHTHIWLSFGPRLEHLLNSPAQHQIHHSDAPHHFHKNFGTNLSIWDWMFGTLYTTTHTPEPLSFGTAERDAHRYQSLYSLIVLPFIDTARKALQSIEGRSLRRRA